MGEKIGYFHTINGEGTRTWTIQPTRWPHLMRTLTGCALGGTGVTSFAIGHALSELWSLRYLHGGGGGMGPRVATMSN
jgi:hypothetical protein